MKLADNIKGAVTGFVMHLNKGMLDDSRWDWDVEKCDWEGYKQALLDPSIVRTTLAVFLNHLDIDAEDKVTNYSDAMFRAFQYFRMLLGEGYKPDTVFTLEEMAEPDWRDWG